MATGRKRSGTLSSQLLAQAQAESQTFAGYPTGPITLQAQVHSNGANSYPNVLLNRERVPYFQIGDVIELRCISASTLSISSSSNANFNTLSSHANSSSSSKHPCIFMIDANDPINLPPNLQISLSRDVAACFGISSGMEVTISKVEKEAYSANAVEVFFSDQYLGRPDMWRISSSLAIKCCHKEQKVQFAGCISATVKHIYLAGKEVKSAYISPETKVIYRSLTAKTTIFVQVCRELWDFADDGERYYEKVVHSFLPDLFKRWKALHTRHVLTVVLISRVFYDSSEVEYAAGPVQRDDDGRDYKDFFKVVIDIEVVYDWERALDALKEAFVAFQRDILLTHHYHRYQAEEGKDQSPRLVGRISYAHDGPILEAINLGLNPTESHYIDRSLSLTGSSTILITPGKGHFRVSKKLLKLTTTRLLDQGFGLDVVALGKAPLHATPLFSFLATDPIKYSREKGTEPSVINREDDVLWGGPADDLPFGTPGHAFDGRSILYWQPFWIYLMFWDKQMDLPFRADKYIPRARMPQFELMGLLHYDLISSIAIPELNTTGLDLKTTEGQNHFDQDVFSTPPVSASSPISIPDSPVVARNSVAKSSLLTSSLAAHGKPSPLRRTPSTNSLSAAGGAVAVPSKLVRTESIEQEESHPIPGRRSRPTSTQFDEATRERLNAALSSSPKNRLSSIMLAAQAERRTRTNSQNLPMAEASSSNLTNLVNLSRKSSTRNKSPQSRRNSTAQTRPRTEIVNPVGGVGNALALASPSTASSASSLAIHSPVSEKPPTDHVKQSSEGTSAEKRQTGGLIPFSRLTSSWLFTPWKLNQTAPKETIQSSVPQNISIQNMDSEQKRKGSGDTQPKKETTQPVAIREPLHRRNTRVRHDDDSNLAPGQRLSVTRTSSVSTSPADTPNIVSTSFRNSTGSGLTPHQIINPSAFHVPVLQTQSALARRWEHLFNMPTLEYQIKWKSMIAPGCLPLTTSYFPTKEELEKAYRTHSYETTLGTEMSESFLVKRPEHDGSLIPEEKWGLAIMRVMVALRLAQGFQFVLLSEQRARQMADHGPSPVPRGPSEVLQDTEAPVILSMSDQIHRLQYDPTGPSIRVERFVRKHSSIPSPIPYKCLIWPKRGGGYTECSTHFKAPEMELYGWNRLDMLAFGYEQQFSESLRYWRTRFIVIPTIEKPEYKKSSGGKPLSDEEIRLIGMEKLAEQFTKARWLKTGETLDSFPAVKFVLTTLDPVSCVTDESVIARLEEIHEAGPLKKKANSNRTLEASAANLDGLAALMRQQGGLSIRDNRWHNAYYPDSFTGEEFVSWVLREFQDVSTREQGAEWGSKLEQRKFLKHCRNYHGFIDGHYYYRLLPPYQTSTARPALAYKFTARILRNPDERSPSAHASGNHSTSPRGKSSSSPGGSGGKSGGNKRRLLSQSMIIDVDSQKRSSQSETAFLHHDIIQNPASAFHFQLHWVGTSAKFIDDMIQTWSRTVDRYGLRLVEAYVDQVTDITKTNVFQSCYPIQFAVPPPPIPPGHKLHPDYFEACLLRRFHYVPDILCSRYYSSDVDVYYSYRNSEFTYSQYVHQSGLAFAQIREGKGYSWLTNRLATIRQVAYSDQFGSTTSDRPNQIMDELNEFCTNAERLSQFWEETLKALNAKAEQALEA